MEQRFRFPRFLKDALFNTYKYTTIRGARRIGKTYNLANWLLQQLLTVEDARSGLWVDTTQNNIEKYVMRYFIPRLKFLGSNVAWDSKRKVLHLPHSKYIDFGSAERPELLEGWGYDRGVLNEAGIILKKTGLWESTILPMTKGDGLFKLAGTPKGKNYFKDLCELDDPNWSHYHFTAYDSPFWDHDELESIKNTISSWRFRQEYLAEFVDGNENALLDISHLRFYDAVDEKLFPDIFIHADTTHTGKDTSDYFALVVLGENKTDKNFYVLDLILKKMDVEAQARATIAMYSKYIGRVRKMTYDEKANQGFGYWIKKMAKEDYKISLPIEELKYPSDKIQHFDPHVPHFKSRRVYFPAKHPQMKKAQEQLLAFPHKDYHDDFVDAMSGVLDNFKIDNKFYFSIV